MLFCKLYREPVIAAHLFGRNQETVFQLQKGSSFSASALLIPARLLPAVTEKHPPGCVVYPISVALVEKKKRMPSPLMFLSGVVLMVHE